MLQIQRRLKTIDPGAGTGSAGADPFGGILCRGACESKVEAGQVS